MADKHTPGPWPLIEIEGKLCPAGEGVSILTVVSEDGTNFAAVYEDADARLISAAPDLLEALKRERGFRIQAQNYIARHHDGEFGLSALEHHLTGVFTGSDTDLCGMATDAAIAKAEGRS